jgi:hypothetical protein
MMTQAANQLDYYRGIDNMFNTNDLNSVASDLCRETAKQTEDIILDQLNEFISRGLIVVEKGPMTLIHDSYLDKITINQSVSLKLKDQEYIEKLEGQIKDLEERLNTIMEALK